MRKKISTHLMRHALATSPQLGRIWSILSEVESDEELCIAGALINKRGAQLKMMADYASIAENGFEPGDSVRIGGIRGTDYKVVRVGVRTVVVTDGTLIPKRVTGTKQKAAEMEETRIQYSARHVKLSDKLFKEARKAHRKLTE